MADIWNAPLPELRRFMEGLPAGSLPEGVERRNRAIGGIPCAEFHPENAPEDRAILYFHGGGFCLGIYPSNSAFVAHIARRTGLDVILPDYSLAPEHPHPAALQEAVAVCRETLQAMPEVVVMGDSSGCALALSAMLSVKEAGGKLPAALVFLTPMLDFAGVGESLRTRAQSDPFGMKDPLAIAKIYLAENDPHAPGISPLYGDLRGLPPILVHAADRDVFLSDSQRLFRKASDAGVRIDLKIWDSMWHIFHMQAATVPQAAQALDEICAFLRSHGKPQDGTETP